VQFEFLAYRDRINIRPIIGGSVQIQNPAPWNLIGRNMTDPPLVLSPTSILPPPLPHCDFFSRTKI